MNPNKQPTNNSLYLHIYDFNSAVRFTIIGLIMFYGISTLVGYLMPNPIIYIYIMAAN